MVFEQLNRFMVGFHLCTHCISIDLGWIAVAMVFRPAKDDLKPRTGEA